MATSEGLSDRMTAPISCCPSGDQIGGRLEWVPSSYWFAPTMLKILPAQRRCDFEAIGLFDGVIYPEVSGASGVEKTPCIEKWGSQSDIALMSENRWLEAPIVELNYTVC